MVKQTGKRPAIVVKKRKVHGHKVKKLRQEGLLPGNIYGRNIKSLAVEGERKKIEKIFSQVGETGLIDLQVEGEKTPRTVLLHNPQYHPITDELIHIDFHQVDLTQKVVASIPIEINGEAPAVEKGQGVLVQLLQEVEVEALPTDLPERLVVDVSSLEEVDQGVTIKDMLKTSSVDTQKVTIKADENQLVVKIEPPTKEEEPAPSEEAEGEEQPAGEETAGGEGEAKEQPSTEEGQSQENQKQEEKQEN